MPIEVRIAGRGRVRDGHKTADPDQIAHCDLCDETSEVVVSTTDAPEGPFSCRDCLRTRLEATTIAVWQLQEAGGETALPWGKISG
jgi:hypothetical protein